MASSENKNDDKGKRQRMRRPRRPRKGIRAKSRSGAIGETWWSKRFVDVFESFSIGSRLGRGRSYARRGQVMNLKIAPGQVSANVQGARRSPYTVRCEVNTLREPDWDRVEEAMTNQSVFVAKLLAGEMPQDIENLFSLCRLSLFPNTKRDFFLECSCPDWANPCKHAAATFYILAEKFDEDPFLVFHFRGRSKRALLENLRQRRREMFPVDVDEDPEDESNGAEEIETADDCCDRFWKAGEELAAVQAQPKASDTAATLLRELGPAPISLRGTNLAQILEPAYDILSIAAERRAFAETEEAEE